MFFSYLKSRARLIIMLAAFTLIFALVFSLYELPAEAVWYSAGLCAILGAAALAYSFVRWRRRCVELEQLRSAVLVDANNLPEPADGLERRYLELVRLLAEERARLEQAADMERRAAADYYAMWEHQIKTPIAAMRLLLQQGGELDRRALRAELFRIEQYVGMVLSYLKLEGDGSDFVLRRRELDDIVRSCLRKFAPLFIMKKLRLDFRETHMTVLTDEKWLAFILEQLLSNSLKYTPGGSISVYAEGNSLVLADTGIGIAPEDLPRLGERGFTGYNGHEDKKSTGLGLYLCRQLCQKLGHHLEISSAPGSGTTVKITFPAETTLYE